MAKDMRDTWKDTGIGLGHAFRDLGKALIKTGAGALRKADEWANSEDYEQEPQSTEQPETPKEEDPHFIKNAELDP